MWPKPLLSDHVTHSFISIDMMYCNIPYQITASHLDCMYTCKIQDVPGIVMYHLFPTTMDLIIVTTCSRQNPKPQNHICHKQIPTTG